ncbi:MAG: DUF3630 family protein [Shewanella sp.]
MPAQLSLNSLEYQAEQQVIAFTAAVDYDSFASFAERLCQALDCRVIEKQWGADRHQWLLDFEETYLELHYEDYGQVSWLTAKSHHPQSAEVLVFLLGLMRPYLQAKRSLS